MVTPADILKGRILIVDDLAPNVAVLEQMLARAGYTSVTATQNPQAVAELHRLNHYDLILLDLQMPGMDGFQVMEALKKIETDGYLPVLVITAQPDHKLRALKAGAKDFISKPFDLAEVSVRVHNMLEIRLLHRSEKKLTQTRLETAQRVGGLGDWEYDFAHHRLLWSEGVYRMLGMSRQDVPPDSALFYRQVHPDDLAFVHRQKEIAVTSGGRIEFEHRLTGADGQLRYIRQVVSMELDEQGEPLREYGTLQDITERKTAQSALQLSEERYRLMFEHNPSPMWVFDPATFEFLAVNTATLALYGYTREEFMRLDAREIRPPEAVPDFLRRTADAPHDLRTVGRFQHRKKDGTVFPVDTLAHGIDFAGRAARLVLAMDMTEAAQAAAVLQRQQAELRVLFDLMPAMIWFKDTHNVMVRVNQHMAAASGHSIAEAEGKSCEELYPLEAAKYYADDLTVIVSGVPKMGIVETLRDSAGRERWVQTDKVPYRDQNGTVIGIVCMALDITDRRLAETALRESEERFKFVARAVSDAVWDCNLVAKTVWWNEGFFTAFGYAVAEVTPSFEAWHTRIHADDRARVVESFEAAVAGATETWSAEYQFERKDGTYAAVLDRGYLLRDATGRAIRMVGGLRDLTEQKKMEEQYLRAQRMDSIGTLAGGIAHDLNNVLAPILMSIELLKLNLIVGAERAKILDTIYISCRRGADLVRQVMSFARGADGQRVAIRLRHLIGDLEAIVSETFPRNLTITIAVAENLWPITGDPTQIHQILLNLTVNARDAMPEGGRLGVAASNITLEAGRAGMNSGAGPGPYILLEVSDTGTGIPPEVRDRIFEPFFTTKEIGKGTGIGLATVQTIVHSHGGFITVDSEVGRGSTFKVYLPADPATRTSETSLPFIVALPRGRDELVLVVDDEFSIRDIMKQTLEAFGYRVVIASDGAEAVALLAASPEKISLAITDMMMPVLDGAAAIGALRLIDPSIRIIAASGIDSGQNVEKAANAGADDFLLKPFNAEQLLKLVRGVLDRPVTTGR